MVLALAPLPFSVRWIDSRPDQFPQYVPQNVVTVCTDAVERELAEAPRDAMIVVMTHSHPLDFDITLAALRRRSFDFVGLIGSETKRARFMSFARQMRLPEGDLERLICPIGIPEIKGRACRDRGSARRAATHRQRASLHTPAQSGDAARVNAW